MPPSLFAARQGTDCLSAARSRLRSLGIRQQPGADVTLTRGQARTSISSLRACLKNPTEIRSLRFGVPRSERGSGAVPPKGGTPNAIFRHALRPPALTALPADLAGISFSCTHRQSNGSFPLTPAL